LPKRNRRSQKKFRLAKGSDEKQPRCNVLLTGFC
jgi:hypothetical protein